jgi:hypothetical protein
VEDSVPEIAGLESGLGLILGDFPGPEPEYPGLVTLVAIERCP